MTEHDEWANRRMTRAEFIAYLAQNSRTSEVEVLQTLDIDRCSCGIRECKGWVAIPKAYWRSRRRPTVPTQGREKE